MNTATTADRIARQMRRTATQARFSGVSTRERNARLRKVIAAMSAPDVDAELAAVWA